ncbi:hypothetical protein M2164_006750 [Streptomyces sp. SAI-208]|uniref:hypothetical protein n=1 Tax=unclassified Streptomyces TaxID=2593676 RepID=UPI00247560F2|nr:MULTISPECIES: hypothetical protein [unclassified Streptomyces]MDH6520135.1 hypothetical protein [Streptomyces sp. SAI-090]MDH6552350.1 hypothetical protein [Streptomyces sp. SAI-041]MDH6611115.1 hypothetical protein [Streptomyces sp. SAI-208]MDH6615774.1 hypothetical protein [Streptomyces sp. SAI-135]
MSTPTPERDSGWISGGVVDAEDARLATGVFAAPGPSPVQARSGIRPATGDPGRVQATATVSGKVTVAPFQGVIQGTRASATGAYLVTLGQQKTLDVLGTNPADSSNPRNDLVVARQRDAQYGDATTGMTVELVKGTAAATPVDPSVSGDFIPLARIRVAKNASSVTATDIDDLRLWTAAAGGILRVGGEGGRPTYPYSGMYIHRWDTNHLEWYDSTAGWRAVNNDTGWVTLSLLPNWTVYNNETPSVRQVGSVVHLRGALQTTVALSTNGTQIITVPAAFRPTTGHHWFTALGGVTRGLELMLRTDGSVVLFPQGSQLPASQLIYLDTTWLVG